MPPQGGQPENPYMKLLESLRATGSQPGAGAGMGQPQQPQPPMGHPGMPPMAGQSTGGGVGQQPEIQDAAIPGQNPGTTKQLVGAMSQLHGVITQLTDPQEIRMIRTIILMLNQLIQRDQQVQNEKTGTMSQPTDVPQGGGMSSGQTPGYPSPAA